MDTRRILTAEYDDLTLAERVDAIREAERRGAEDAAADNGAAGGIDQLTADPRDYYSRVIEPAYHAGAIDDAQADAWRDELVAAESDLDPRVQAYLRGWAEAQREALAEAAELAADR